MSRAEERLLDPPPGGRINHQECFATSKQQHINGIENFWGYAKTKLKSYYGVSREHFYFYLKEM